MSDGIQIGDVVKYEAPKGNGFIEGEVEQKSIDGTFTVSWRGRESHNVAGCDIIDVYRDGRVVTSE